jgi:DNA modification methylase
VSLNVNKIEFGDCRETMKRWIEEGVKVQTCITSPPYFGLRDYGHDNQIGLESEVGDYVRNLVDVFALVRNLLCEDGTLWLNLGDSYSGSGKGPSKSLNGEQHHLEGKHSKIVPDGLKAKDLIGIPWRVAFALQADGWYLRQDIIWHKPNPMPESVQDRCTKNHEYIFLLSKKSKYYFDNEAIKEPVKQDWGTRDRSDGKYHNEGSGLQPHSGLEKSYEMANKRSVWTVTTKPFHGAHFAVFPPDLIEPCVLAGSKPKDIVLDPFMGSGTTAAVAQRLNRLYLGCELNTDYEVLQKERLKQPSLELL